jgi:hypothetical protein
LLTEVFRCQAFSYLVVLPELPELEEEGVVEGEGFGVAVLPDPDPEPVPPGVVPVPVPEPVVPVPEPASVPVPVPEPLPVPVETLSWPTPVLSVPCPDCILPLLDVLSIPMVVPFSLCDELFFEQLKIIPILRIANNFFITFYFLVISKLLRSSFQVYDLNHNKEFSL